MYAMVFGKSSEQIIWDFLSRKGCIVEKNGYESTHLHLAHLLKICSESSDEESRIISMSLRKRSDRFIFLPEDKQGERKIMSVELKTWCDFPRDLGEFLENNYFMSQVDEIFNYNPSSRLMIHDIRNKTFKFLNSNFELTLEKQQKFWNDPLETLPLFNNLNDFEREYDFHVLGKFISLKNKISSELSTIGK